MWDFIKGIEELTAEQRKELRTALESAFPEPQNLELMIYDEFGISFKAITQGQANYQLDLQKLVQWAESQGKLPRLLEGASKSNPGNPKLNKLCKKWCPDYISYSQKEKLKEIITGIESKKINEIARQVIDQYNPYIIIDNYRDFNNYSSDKLIKILLDNSLDKENNLFLKFVKYLCNDNNIDQDICGKLKEWLKEEEPNFDFSSFKLFDQEQSYINKETTQSYLMVTLEEKSNNKLLMNAWLLLDNPKLKQLIPVDYNGEQKGAECTWDEAPSKLAEFIANSDKIYYTKNLVIDLFLPFEYLGKQVYCWEIEEYGDRRRLSCDYLIFVRSYDRFIEGRFRSKLEDRWKQWIRFFQQERNADEIKHQFEHLDIKQIKDKSHWKELEKRLLEKEKFGLKSAYLPQSDGEKQKALFRTILYAGIPLAILLADGYLPERNLWEDIDQLLSVDSPITWNNFFEFFQKKCRKIYNISYSEEHLGSHLLILCDDPNRIPPIFERRLIPTGQ